jgi:C4-dicarboxylate-specific signal transduction histidine kinase
MNIAVNSRTDLSMSGLVPTDIDPDVVSWTRIEITDDSFPLLKDGAADCGIASDTGERSYDGVIEEVDFLLRQARLRELVAQARMMEAIRLCSKEVTHDFNNLFQTVVSGLDLIQVRVEQGRLSEISDLIERTHAALERAGKLAGRLPRMWSAAAVEVEGERISEHCP